MVATELIKLAMETEEGRKERLKKMVARTLCLRVCGATPRFTAVVNKVINKVD